MHLQGTPDVFVEASTLPLAEEDPQRLTTNLKQLTTILSWQPLNAQHLSSTPPGPSLPESI